jgi:hypothetical protein
MPIWKKRLFTLAPAFSALLAPLFLVLPIGNDLRDMLMGVCIGVSIVALGALVKLKRSERC